MGASMTIMGTPFLLPVTSVFLGNDTYRLGASGVRWTPEIAGPLLPQQRDKI